MQDLKRWTERSVLRHASARSGAHRAGNARLHTVFTMAASHHAGSQLGYLQGTRSGELWAREPPRGLPPRGGEGRIRTDSDWEE